jgi:hypothetical protein
VTDNYEVTAIEKVFSHENKCHAYVFFFDIFGMDKARSGNRKAFKTG